MAFSESAESSVNDSAAGGFGAREMLVIWLLLVSAFVVILNETVMGVALPKLMTELHITAGEGQWLTTVFLLTMSVVIPVTGMLIQRVPTRRLFIFAMSLFSVGTLVAALAPGFVVLLLARAVQAGGTAIMMPLLMTTVTTLVPPAIRGRLMGRIAIVISVAPAIGPTLSGVILQIASWRWLFLAVLPIALLSLLVGALRITNVGETQHRHIDVFSVLLSVPAFGGVVFALSSLGEQGGGGGHAAWVPLVAGVVGLLSLVLFVLRQLALQKRERALLDLRTFQSRPFAISVIMFSFTSMALFGSLILLPIFVQNVLGYNTLQTGLLLLPGGLLMGLLGPLVGRIVDRYGAKTALLPGSIITALSLWGASVLISDATPFWQVLVVHLVLSIGLAGVFTPLFEISLGSLQPRLVSFGSATISTVQQLAGAAGTALFVTVMQLVALQQVTGGVSLRHATAFGIAAAFMIGAIAATVGALLVLLLPRRSASAGN